MSKLSKLYGPGVYADDIAEILRCSFDRGISISAMGEVWLEAPSITISAAIHARVAVATEDYDLRCELGRHGGRDYFDQCLEAARRVEERSWP